MVPGESWYILGTRADVWSMGVLMLELLTHSLPFLPLAIPPQAYPACLLSEEDRRTWAATAGTLQAHLEWVGLQPPPLPPSSSAGCTLLHAFTPLQYSLWPPSWAAAGSIKCKLHSSCQTQLQLACLWNVASNCEQIMLLECTANSPITCTLQVDVLMCAVPVPW